MRNLWFWFFVSSAAATVAGAVIVEVLGLETGRLGSYLGILIMLAAFTALVTLLAGKVGWQRAIGAGGAVLAIGGLSEIVGLYTGYPFGRYSYTDWWLPYVRLPGGHVYPLLLPFAWFIIVTCCYLVMCRRFSGWAAVLSTGLAAAIVDVVLEPVLTRVVLFWHWKEPTPLFGAPYQNFFGWLLTAVLAAGALEGLAIWRGRSLAQPVWMLVAMLFFTAVIGVAYHEHRGLAALLPLPLVWWFWRGRAGANA